MRDILYKNLTSSDRRRKIIASSEVIDKEGLRYVIHRHFIYLIKEIESADSNLPQPYLYVLKERNTKEQKETFFCRVKRGVILANDQRLFLVTFMHSLKINLTASAHTINS